MKKILHTVKNLVHKLDVIGVVNAYHLSQAMLANIVYGFPSRKITVIGVTGTDGKTTTTHMIYHILKDAGKKVSVSSTVFADIGGQERDTGLHTTTGSRWQIQKNLRDAVKSGSEYFVLETTSHGIAQHRVWGVQYDVSVLTNVTEEHLDYHGTYDAYLRTKAKLLLRSKKAIINKDDRSFEQIKAILEASDVPYATYSLTTKKADYTWNDNIRTSLNESFNKENLLAAIGCCTELGISKKEILKGVQSFKLPKGRFDIIQDKPFRVIVDFAHTPNSIRKLLGNFKKGRGRIIHVFGSAGLRDDKKRPDMGRASGENADIVIITEEDYRTEEFTDISNAISSGLFELGFTYYESQFIHEHAEEKKIFTTVKNRQKAIDLAIQLAHQYDTVLTTGKGHEQSLARGNKEYPWDEFKAVERALADKKYHDN